MTDAKFILDNSELLVKSDCRIYNNVLYERCFTSEADKVFADDVHKYRFFIDVDDYDYVEDEALIAELDKLYE